MWQLRSQGGVRFAPFRGWWPPCHFTPSQNVFPPAKAAAKYAIRMKTPQHLPVWVSLRSFTRKGRFQEKLSQVETQGISVQKSFSWRSKTKDGKGLKPEDVYRLYGYSYGSSILDSWDSQEGAERTVRVLETSVPWPELWSTHLSTSLSTHKNKINTSKTCRCFCQTESLEVSSGSSGGGSLPSHLSCNSTWPRSCSCNRPNYLSENGKDCLLRITSLFCLFTGSQVLEFRMVSRSRIYAPRPQASEYPRGWRPVEDHRLRIGPTFSALAHWILSSKCRTDPDVSHFHLMHVSFDTFAGRGPITKFVVTLWYRAPELILMDRRQCMSSPQLQVFVLCSALLFYFYLPYTVWFAKCSMMFDAPRILQGMGKVLTFGPWAASLQRWQQIVLFFQATLKSTRRLDSQTDLESRELKMPKLYRCIPNHPKSHSFASCGLLCTNCCIAFSNYPWTSLQYQLQQHSIQLDSTLINIRLDSLEPKLRLFKIFQLKGTPTIETWPTLENLGHFSRSFPRWQAQNHNSLSLTLVTRTQSISIVRVTSLWT